MKYFAKVVRVCDDVEEEVVLRINGLDITCFASVCPFQIQEGLTYQVALTPVVHGNYSVREVPASDSSCLIKADRGFACEVFGELSGDRINVGGISLEDEVLLRDYGYLEGKRIAWKIDRIDVDFLSQETNLV